MAEPVSMMAAAMLFGGASRGKTPPPPPPPPAKPKKRPAFTEGQTPSEQASAREGMATRSKLRIPKAGYAGGAGVNY